MVTLAKALVKLPNVQFTGIQCYQGYAPGMLNKNCLRSGKTYCGCLGINWFCQRLRLKSVRLVTDGISTYAKPMIGNKL